VLIVRLKQCETALAGGRLDEAFELVRRPDVRNHRRGQELCGKVAGALVERARTHLAAGHLTSAAQDAEKANQLAGNSPEVTQLRNAISHAMSEERRVGQLRDQVLATARHHAEIGQLTIGEKLIADAPIPDPRAELLKRDIAVKRSAMDAALEKATASLKSDDWEAAIEHLCKIDRACRSEPSVREAFSQINTLAASQITDAIEEGRLDVAVSLLARLEKLPSQSPDAERLRRTLRQCRDAVDRLAKADAAGVDQILRTLAPLWPRAKWLQSAASQVRQVRDAIEQLRSGPLGLGGLPSDPAETVAFPSPNGAPTPRSRKSPQRSQFDFVLQVDGAGGFRVIDRTAVTIGPVSSSRPVDVPLMADATLPTITITRCDEDYFLQSSRPVLVNDQPTTNKLLAHGDRIGLGPRVRITFRRPSVASTSAVLDLSGTRLPQGDVRHVILLDRELIVGPGTSAHIRADDLSSPAVVQRRDGKLVCRAGSTTTELEPGVHVTLGPIGLAVA
ncbi:MAG TPA: hypothetical protein VN541_03970, partial [Tepidisphaeraceae bacterium]|nr:hypothetical protein [Tepidisphaeraceae bacterium]